jgi:hypothetical protein
MFIGVCELVFLSRLVEAKPTIGRKTAVVRKAWFWLRQNVMSSSVLKIDLLSVTAVLLACNLLIYTFVNLEEVKQEAAHAQSTHIVQLKKFYAELGEIFFAQLPADMSSADYDRWEAEASEKEEEEEVLKWVFANMGRAAEQRLADFHDVTMTRQWTGAINPKHNVMKSATFQMQKNVRALFETNLWDKD